MIEPLIVTVDAKGMPLAAVDPNVKIPDNVRQGSAAADTLHAQAYTPQPVQPVQPVQPEPPQSEPPQPAQARPAASEPERASWDAAKWMQHAKSMEGRYNQSKEQILNLQTAVSEIGEELVRTQALTARQPAPPVAVPQPQPAPVLITQQDVDTYGNDFLDVAQRAAIQAVTPKLNALEQRNQQLERQVRRQTIQSIESVLDGAIPNWPAINLSDKFKSWLRRREIYSNRVRSDLLSEAHRAADAARVLSFFKGFLAEEEATGSTEFLPTQQEPTLPASPHAPAVELQTLAAPGRARPAQGSTPNQPADGPIWITRGQISQFFANVRKGVYVGREQDYMNDQAIIFECERAGRIR